VDGHRGQPRNLEEDVAGLVANDLPAAVQHLLLDLLDFQAGHDLPPY